MAGGGASGAVDFPTHMKNFHQELLQNSGTPSISAGNDLASLIDAAISAATPYSGETAYNPDTDISTIQTRLTTWITAVDALDADTDWSTFLASVVTAADNGTTLPSVDLTTVLSSTAITNAIATVDDAVDATILDNASTSFQNRSEGRYQRGVGNFAAGMADINAVNSSAFIFGLAMLQNDRQIEITEYEKQVDQQVRSRLLDIVVKAQYDAAAQRLGRRDNLVINGVNQVTNHDEFRLQQLGTSTDEQLRVSGGKITAKVDEKQQQLAYDVEDALWDFKLFEFGGNFLASISGAPTFQKPPSGAQSAVAGVLGGASAGAAFGPVGAGVGALGGLLLSL